VKISSLQVFEILKRKGTNMDWLDVSKPWLKKIKIDAFNG
jgi:hypothetical protein